MNILFTPVEIRVLGCLVEKESTTPESYPLSLNSLTRACNQKSNREPIMDLSEATVLEAIENLIKYTLVSNRSGSDSRVPKYSHRLQDRRDEEFDFNKAELAVLSTLFLHGPQTLGQIRTRCSRVHNFNDLQSLSETLKRLTDRQNGPYIKQIARHPGQKEPRFTHLFAGDVVDETPPESMAHQLNNLDDSTARITELEFKVSKMQKDLAELELRLNEFVKQFE